MLTDLARHGCRIPSLDHLVEVCIARKEHHQAIGNDSAEIQDCLTSIINLYSFGQRLREQKSDNDLVPYVENSASQM